MARSAWSGALTFAGFPIPLKAYTLTPSSKNESFKTLCACHGQPIAQQNTCRTSGKTLGDSQQKKGVETAKDVYVELAPTAVEQINGVGKTVALEIEKVCPVRSLDLHALTGGLTFLPEPGKGAEKPVAILWRVLTKLDAAIVTRWIARAGSRDSILAIYPGPRGLYGANLPFAHQLSDAPVFAACDVTVADAEVVMFEGALTSMYPNGDYAAADFTSEYKVRRQAAIDAAVAGKPIDVAAAPAAPPVPDLMAALSASLAAVQPKEAVPA